MAAAAALLTQLETLQTLPGMSLAITAEVAGYRRTLVCQNNEWDGYDLTHQFLDERSTTVYGPSHDSTFEQEASLKMMPINQLTLQLPPSQTVSYQQPMPQQTQIVPSYAGSPDFGMQHRMPPAVVQSTTRVQTASRVQIAFREPSESRLLPLPSPDLTGRNPNEQAVIVALQAVANYPESSDILRALQQRVPGLAGYLQAAAQPSGCESSGTPTGGSPMEADVTLGDGRALPTSSNDEAGQEITASTSAGSITESPISRPPPDKQQPRRLPTNP